MSLHDLLSKFSTHVFHIQHGVFRANHYAQGIIALHKMGAGPERLMQFTNWYLPTLEDSNNFIVPDSRRSVVHLAALKGKELSYNLIRDHYWNKLKCDYNGSIEDLIRKEFPPLTAGLSSSAFHGTIHTGYGFSVGSDLVVCEGLAYLFHSYKPLVVKNESLLRELKWRGTEPAVNVLEEVSKDQKLKEEMVAAETPENLRAYGKFQTRLTSLQEKCGDDLLRYANRIQISASEISDIRNFILHIALKVYLMAEVRNDFFLLHGVTSSWALRTILGLVSDNEQQQVIALRTFMCSLIGTYAAQDAPDLNPEYLRDSIAISMDWTDIIQEAITGNRDEHILKMVQICHDMSKEFPENEELYKTASLTSMKYPFVYTHDSAHRGEKY